MGLRSNLHVKVVGAGVAGLACAVHLLAHGVSVTVTERSAQLWDDASSWLAGGMLAPWCEGENAEPIVMSLGSHAGAWWKQYVSGLQEHGTLVLAHARDKPELKRFSNRTLHYEWVDQTLLAQLEPDLADRFELGLLYRRECHLDPRYVLQQLATRICAQGGAIHVGVDGCMRSFGEDLTLDCRGVDARDTLPDLRGVRGEMLILKTDEVRLGRVIRVLHPRFPLYVVPREKGVIMVGATMLESNKKGGTSVRSAVELLNAAYALHPALAEAEILELSAGIRPAFPSNLPRIVRAGRTIIINGLYRHGFLLAPAVAQLAVRAVLDPAFTPELAYAFDTQWPSV